ncbi:MAG: hypothetical protein E6J14_13200, partial [Chloroflexi bacterium]
MERELMTTVAQAPASTPPQQPSATNDRQTRRWRVSPVRQRELVVALFLLLCFGFFHQIPLWNEPTRYDLVVALVDHHTTQIDVNQSNTGDKALYKGHYYTDKAPGSSFLGVPVYAAIRVGERVFNTGERDMDSVLQILAFILSGVPTVLLALLLLRFLRSMVEEWWAFIVTLGLALATIVFPFATMFFGHALAAFFLFATFYVVWRLRPDAPAWHALGAGLLAGWAVAVDYSALLGVVLVLIYALSRGRRAPLLMIAGAVPPALLVLGYNWVSFGGPFHWGYSNNVTFNNVFTQGVLGLSVPRPNELHDLLIGTRGLLRLSPWLALAPLGLMAARSPRWRREIAVCAAVPLIYILANSGYAVPLGGSSPGPRFLIPSLPFIAILVALIPRALRAPTAVLMAISTALVLVATATSPTVGTEAVHDPLPNLWLPLLGSRNLTDTTAWLHWGLHGVQPLLLLGLAAVLTAAALVATMRPALSWKRVGAGAITAVALITVSLGTPVDATAPLRGAAAKLGAGGSSGDHLTIADAGATALPADSDQQFTVRPWAQVEAAFGDLPAAVVVFTIHAPDGTDTWS